jgi:hypothetical protein
MALGGTTPSEERRRMYLRSSPMLRERDEDDSGDSGDRSIAKGSEQQPRVGRQSDAITPYRKIFLTQNIRL